MYNKDRACILRKFIQEFPTCWGKPGDAYDPDSTAVIWSGDGSELPICDGEHTYLVPAFDLHHEEGGSYDYGVHERLVDFAEEFGGHWEAVSRDGKDQGFLMHIPAY